MKLESRRFITKQEVEMSYSSGKETDQDDRFENEAALRQKHLIRDSHYHKDVDWPKRVKDYVVSLWMPSSREKYDLKLIERLGI